MRRLIILALTLVTAAFTAVAGPAQYSFEGSVPSNVRVRGRGDLSLNSDRYKDGSQSLKFSWLGQAELMIVDQAAIQASLAKPDNGVMLWICNETPSKEALHIAIKSAAGAEICGFDFNLDFAGWRAAWVKYQDMTPAPTSTDGAYLSIRPSPRQMQGAIYLDRLSFSKSPLHIQVTPDAQIPGNNAEVMKGRRWHWIQLWEWWQLPELQVSTPSSQDLASLDLMRKHLDDFYANEPPLSGNYDPVKARTKLDARYDKLNITRLADGTTKGTPMVSNDESTASDIKMKEAVDIMYRYALDYKYSGNKQALERFFNVADYLDWQGLAFGSGMGTNHHYGYNIRGWSNSLWMLRDEIRQAGKNEQYFKSLEYWSGLAECRADLDKTREGVVDAWNTLLIPKITSAMLKDSDAEKVACLKSIERWMSESMMYTDGTMGGFKVDGTSFHHGGHYPAYTVDAFSTLGPYFGLVDGTTFVPTLESRKCAKNALMALRTYCNLKNWGIGISGRHPFDGYDKPDGNIAPKVVECFGNLAVLGDLSGSGKAFDEDLAGAYLALGGKSKGVVSRLGKLKAAAAPQGFFVYNYAALGIHRRSGWMLTLKAYNSDVWGSEIYANDNRYGRYQSYGSVQIINSGNPASAAASGYSEAGWDWNRLPGTTTIHLPFDKLNSPLKGTLMEKNDSRFPGVSSLEGKNGVLAFTYTERPRTNFCAGATATKSVFCFDNRIVFIGTGISNNSSYPTETTLFQQSISGNSSILADGQLVNSVPSTWTHSGKDAAVVEDLNGNCYIVPEASNLQVMMASQTSPNNTNKKTGSGNFATAILNHGVSPQNASYEYLLLVEPSGADRKAYSKKLPYEVLCRTSAAHVVKDNPTGITAYVCYGEYQGTGTLVSKVEAETIVMERPVDGGYVMSICTPDLGIQEKEYTTSQPSKVIEKTIQLEGTYSLASSNPSVKVSTSGGKTSITASCIHGQPVEFTLKKL